MEQLLYHSAGTTADSSREVFRIVEVSARNNPAREITGFLIYAHGCFLQLIEGPAASLDELLHVLAKDTRHRDIRVLSRRPIAMRQFPRWRMERLSATDSGIDAILVQLTEAGLPREVVEKVGAFLAVSKAA